MVLASLPGFVFPPECWGSPVSQTGGLAVRVWGVLPVLRKSCCPDI